MAETKRPDGTTDKFTDGIQPQWAPRVPPGKIRRLYQHDAMGLVDEDLIADVGTMLYLRCQSMVTAKEAQLGRATCPRCDAVIPHTRSKAQRITCPACAWQTTVGDYL